MRVLLIEDEHFAAERLKKILMDSGREIQILALLDSVKSSVEWFRNHPSPDLVFLDIQLADGLSFSIFEQVPCKAPVIFTTAYDEYAIRAFEIHSIDYLLKPIDPEKLKAALRKYDELKNLYPPADIAQLLNTLRESIPGTRAYKNRFLVNKADTLISLPVDQVAFFFAEDKSVILFTHDAQKFVLNESLDHLETVLDPARFFRVNRQCLLSAGSIKRLHSYFNYKLKVEINPSAPEDIIVSKAKVQSFKDWLNR